MIRRALVAAVITAAGLAWYVQHRTGLLTGSLTGLLTRLTRLVNVDTEGQWTE